MANIDKIYELQKLLRKQETSKRAIVKIGERIDKNDRRVADEPEGAYYRVQSGLSKIVFYNNGKGAGARIYNIMGFESMEVGPDVAGPLCAIFEYGAQLTEGQFDKAIRGSDPRNIAPIKLPTDIPAFDFIVDAFYDKIIGEPRRKWEMAQSKVAQMAAPSDVSPTVQMAKTKSEHTI